MKHLIRTIVMSHTYRQSSLPTPEIDAKDPENRLLARQSRFRVDAENVHDIALEVSGLLQNRFGGPSVKPYQPDGYMATLNFPKREYSASRGDGPLPARRLHAVAAHFPASQPAQLRRAHARGMHGEPGDTRTRRCRRSIC